MAEINLEIITPEKIIYKDSVDSITVPGTKGMFQVLKDHAPLMSTIEIGVITLKKNDENTYLTTAGGTMEVLNNNVLILADSVEVINDIDIERAEHAKTRAEENLTRKKGEEIDFVRAELALKRAINRINAREKYI
ncbi:MAG: F0F1 ATP synthase subunit epsilon [Ignavibacteriaceae bacterium]|jgi:F-type H+-transporting ATPase subunit epsilon